MHGFTTFFRHIRVVHYEILEIRDMAPAGDAQNLVLLTLTVQQGDGFLKPFARAYREHVPARMQAICFRIG